MEFDKGVFPSIVGLVLHEGNEREARGHILDAAMPGNADRLLVCAIDIRDCERHHDVRQMFHELLHMNAVRSELHSRRS
jgi:hypothetical protein